jgi:hypothetical protein
VLHKLLLALTKCVSLGNSSDSVSSPQINPSLRVPCLQKPDLLEFHQNWMLKRTPVVLRGLLNEWPAFCDPKHKWCDMNYIRRIAGRRTVPVELGSHYLHDKWSTKLMTINDFLDQYILSNSGLPPQISNSLEHPPLVPSISWAPNKLASPLDV